MSVAEVMSRGVEPAAPRATARDAVGAANNAERG